jgi:hypothetical protein
LVAPRRLLVYPVFRSEANPVSPQEFAMQAIHCVCLSCDIGVKGHPTVGSGALPLRQPRFDERTGPQSLRPFASQVSPGIEQHAAAHRPVAGALLILLSPSGVVAIGAMRRRYSVAQATIPTTPPPRQIDVRPQPTPTHRRSTPAVQQTPTRATRPPVPAGLGAS